MGRGGHPGRPGQLRLIKPLGTWGKSRPWITERRKELGPQAQFPPHLLAETAGKCQNTCKQVHYPHERKSGPKTPKRTPLLTHHGEFCFRGQVSYPLTRGSSTPKIQVYQAYLYPKNKIMKMVSPIFVSGAGIRNTLSDIDSYHGFLTPHTASQQQIWGKPQAVTKMRKWIILVICFVLFYKCE